MATPRPPPPRASQDLRLVPLGPRHVQARHRAGHGENGLKPSTSRALVLRNGKHGARGTGQLMSADRMTGREKLDLLAEDLVSQKSRSALMAPLSIDKCIRIADSQYNACLDDIADLKDPDLFHDRIEAELVARSPHRVHDGQQLVRDATHIASVVSTRIHNAYMVASAWKIVIDILRELHKSGLDDATVRTRLQTDESLRSRYLVLYDILGVLVDLGQAHFSVLAMTTPHYSRYFRQVEDANTGEPSVAFDWADLKYACKSFIDSIIIELCFPRAPYPKRILCQILHDAIDESPKEAKRFPQSMWDAVGDLSVLLELQELLDSPLSGRQGEKLRKYPRQMPERYERWLDAQIYSRRASESCANFKDFINPLERTRDPSVLDDMWKFINLNYKVSSGASIDSLWGLDEALRRAPQWSSFYMPSLRTYEPDSDDGHPLMPSLKNTRKKVANGKKKSKKPLAITDGHADEDSSGSMPELQAVSDSSGDNDEDDFFFENDVEDDEEDEEEESDYDYESEYNSEEEGLCGTMLRDAMDTAMAIPEFFDPKSNVPEFDALTEETKANPFLKLLGSLRGRIFSSNPKLSSTTRTEPRKGFLGRKGQTSEPLAKPAAISTQNTEVSDVSDDKIPPTPPIPSRDPVTVSTSEEPKNYRVIVEDAEDEEDAPSIAGKKKKKKPKKKKKKKTSDELPTVHEDTVNTPQKSLPSTAPAETPAKPPSSKLPASSTSVNSLARTSTSSLPIQPTVAKSAHSYLQGLGAPKEKVKTRPDHAPQFSDNKGLLSKLSPKDKSQKENENDPTINKKFTWFTKLGKKTAGYMHQLMRINADEKAGSLKWENFVKVMRDMGFKCDPSTAGSSVRFDPPNAGDRSISIHKPHPDSTLYPYHLREIGKKLRSYYGWSEDDFLRRTSTV